MHHNRSFGILQYPSNFGPKLFYGHSVLRFDEIDIYLISIDVVININSINLELF